MRPSTEQWAGIPITLSSIPHIVSYGGEVAKAKQLLEEGIDSAQKAVTIAPRSVKAFNLLNLLYRASAAIEPG